MSKTKWHVKAIYLVVAVALVLGFALMPLAATPVSADIAGWGSVTINPAVFCCTGDDAAIITVTATPVQTIECRILNEPMTVTVKSLGLMPEGEGEDVGTYTGN